VNLEEGRRLTPRALRRGRKGLGCLATTCPTHMLRAPNVTTNTRGDELRRVEKRKYARTVNGRAADNVQDLQRLCVTYLLIKYLRKFR
jgi:hypothetical protein